MPSGSYSGYMSGLTKFGALGPLTVHIVEVELPHSRPSSGPRSQRLLLRANRRVSMDNSIEAIWGTESSASAVGTLWNYVEGLGGLEPDRPMSMSTGCHQ